MDGTAAGSILSVVGERIVAVQPSEVEAEPVSPFASAWAAVGAATEARGSLNDLWNQMRAERTFRAAVDTDPDGDGRIDVHCAWPNDIRQAMEYAVISFVDALGQVFDAAILATAQVVCAAIGEPDADLHRMPYLPDRATFWQRVRNGHFPGIRPDQVRLVETFQPFEEPGLESSESAAATMVRSAMRHFANLRATSSDLDDSPRVVVWAHSAEPEVFVDPPARVVSVVSTGDGVLDDSRTVATYQVAGDLDRADGRGNPNIAFDVIANRSPWPADPGE